VESLYDAYPRHVGKGAALKAIAKALTKVTFDVLQEAVGAYATACASDDPQYLPYPATWFNEERWNDDRKEWGRNGRILRQGPGVIYNPKAAEGSTVDAKW
jgi:hypothetical protein